MLPHQLRKAVEAANQMAQQQRTAEDEKNAAVLSTQEYSRLAELQKQRAHLEMRQLQVYILKSTYVNISSYIV